jgi:hypothetical protein
VSSVRARGADRRLLPAGGRAPHRGFRRVDVQIREGSLAGGLTAHSASVSTNVLNRLIARSGRVRRSRPGHDRRGAGTAGPPSSPASARVRAARQPARDRQQRRAGVAWCDGWVRMRCPTAQKRSISTASVLEQKYRSGFAALRCCRTGGPGVRGRQAKSFGPSRGTVRAFYLPFWRTAGRRARRAGIQPESSGSRLTLGEPQPVIGDVELEPASLRGLEAGGGATATRSTCPTVLADVVEAGSAPRRRPSSTASW